MKKNVFVLIIWFILPLLSLPVKAIDTKPITPSTETIEISTKAIVTTNTCPLGCTCTNNAVSCPAPTIIPKPTTSCPVGCTCEGDKITCSVPPGSTKVCPVGCTCENDITVCQAPPTKPLPTVTCPKNCNCSGGEVLCSRPPILEVCPVGCTCSEGTTTCPANQKPIVVEVTSGTKPISVTIEKSGDQIMMTANQVSAITNEKIFVNNSQLYLGKIDETRQIKITPPEIKVMISDNQIIRQIKLIQQGEKPVYEVTGNRPAKILYFIPISVPRTTVIDANNGSALSEKEPWWGFLAK